MEQRHYAAQCQAGPKTNDQHVDLGFQQDANNSGDGGTRPRRSLRENKKA